MSAVTEGLSTTKTKRFKVKHPKRKLYRSSEPLLSVFMWGINHTVRELTHVSLPGNIKGSHTYNTLAYQPTIDIYV